MSTVSYPVESTALLIVDPYNDFLSEGGKVFGMTKETREKFNSLANMKKVIAEARAKKIQVFIVPHHRAVPGDIKNWKHPTPSQIIGSKMQFFAAGTWGGEFNPEYGPKDGDVVIHEHYAQSGFANTDLDLQLKQRGITHLILIGMLANSCVETTGKYGVELGYHVTLVRDATAALSLDGMHAAHEVDGPMFAQSIVTSEELTANLRRLSTAKLHSGA